MSRTKGVCRIVLFFFFQAEDGIRDVAVTGVQTCALPISSAKLLGDLSTENRGRSERRRSPRAPRPACGRAARRPRPVGGRASRTNWPSGWAAIPARGRARTASPDACADPAADLLVQVRELH